MSVYNDRVPPRQPMAGCLSLFFVLPLLVLIALLVFWWRGGTLGLGTGLNPNAQVRPVTARGSLSEAEKANIEIYEQASPSLVQVTNLTEQGDGLGLEVQEVPKGVGSGFIWDKDGHVVTNFHVIEGADAAHVTLANHSTYDTKQLWAYPDEDIAVLWINPPQSELHPIPVGTSHDLKVGQIVYTLGDPFGLDQTMSTGIISALGRQISSPSGREIRGVIQTTAAINPGNSGGPLLDSAGRLIGMNTAIISPSGAFAGVGFAIPVDEINRIVPQLIRHGKVVHPHLGVQIAPDQVAQQLGIDQGALIVKVVPNGPAARAGLHGTQRDKQGGIQLGDVIVAVDNKPIENLQDLNAALDHHKAGDTVTLTILRQGQRQDVQVKLEAE